VNNQTNRLNDLERLIDENRLAIATFREMVRHVEVLTATFDARLQQLDKLSHTPQADRDTP
jgi:hypothetical protein